MRNGMYLKNLTDHLIRKHRYDKVHQNLLTPDQSRSFIKESLGAQVVNEMSPKTLGEIMCSFEIGDIMSAHPGKEVSFSGDCESMLRELVALCLAYLIVDRLNGTCASKMPEYV